MDDPFVWSAQDVRPRQGTLDGHGPWMNAQCGQAW
jgi:hypothetical protein